ncbi:MAG: hydantoinase/oxoprolinase family protein [Nitrospirales bacterium]
MFVGNLQPRLFIGIDIGGTFTDFVLFDETANQISTFKILSTPSSPAKAVLQGLERLSSELPRTIIHGSTVATNALLERKGARTAFVTTKGFRDILRLGRQNRRALYDWFSGGVEPLVSSDLCFEIPERIDYQGHVLISLDVNEIPALVDFLHTQHVQSVAISFLFSFTNPAHEQEVAQCFRQEGFFVTASQELLPEFREYERASTTVVNAYVSPVLDQYLGELEDTLGADTFYIMQSNGGRIQATQARQQGVHSILSGPAGGVVGAVHVAKLAGCDRFITFDMGGTSTDVSLVDGEIETTSEAEVGGFPIRVPVIDIHTVGAGGGSLVRVDKGGALRVGPESAGADPGPVCYGRGGLIPTVTDANVLLGRLPASGLLGGQLPFDIEASSKAMAVLAEQLDLQPQAECSEVEAAVLGIVQVVNAQMERAIRVISVERGHDPRDYALVSFGGAGGGHACDLARGMGIRRVLIPSSASTLSAYGMLTAHVRVDAVQTIMRSDEPSYEELQGNFAPMIEKSRSDLKAQGVKPDDVEILSELDVRYVGQSYELTVPFSKTYRASFDAQHQQRYGYRQEDAPIEIVNLRVQGIGRTKPPSLSRLPIEASANASHAVTGTYRLVLPDGPVLAPHFSRERLRPGNEIDGPAVIIQDDTTIVLGINDHARVDEYANLHIEIYS